MQKQSICCFVCLLLCLVSGCSIHPIRIVSNSTHLENKSDIALIEPDNPNLPFFINVNNTDDGNIHYIIEPKNATLNIDADKDSFRIKYNWLQSVNQCAIITGAIKKTGRRYPIVLDTGLDNGILINDVHIKDNNLAIYPFKTTKGLSSGSGFCYLPELELGKVTLKDFRCFYFDSHIEVQIFGIPIVYTDYIFVGIPAIRSFKYVLFDNLNKEVELSTLKKFDPKNLYSWNKYPFSIEKKYKNDAGIFVRIPVEGKNMKLMVDTGSADGLMLTQKSWERMPANDRNIKLKREKIFFVGTDGIPCKKGIIKKLKIGNRLIPKAEVLIFSNDCPYGLPGKQGAVGMQYFQDTVIVFDFERSLFWVKR